MLSVGGGGGGIAIVWPLTVLYGCGLYGRGACWGGGGGMYDPYALFQVPCQCIVLPGGGPGGGGGAPGGPGKCIAAAGALG